MGKQRMVPRPYRHRARPPFFAKRTLFHCHVRQQEQQQQIENDTELVYGRQISKREREGETLSTPMYYAYAGLALRSPQTSIITLFR